MRRIPTYSSGVMMRRRRRISRRVQVGWLRYRTLGTRGRRVLLVLLLRMGITALGGSHDWILLIRIVI